MVEDVEATPQDDLGGDDFFKNGRLKHSAYEPAPPAKPGRPKGGSKAGPLRSIDELEPIEPHYDESDDPNDDLPIPDNPDEADIRAWFRSIRKKRLEIMWRIARDKKTPLQSRIKLLERFDDMDRGKPAVQAPDDGGDDVGSVVIEKF